MGLRKRELSSKADEEDLTIKKVDQEGKYRDLLLS